MINQLLQDIVVYGTICPMFGQIFAAACTGRTSVSMVVPNHIPIDALKAQYEKLGFHAVSGFNLEQGAHTLTVTFARTLEELTKGEDDENAKSVQIAP